MGQDQRQLEKVLTTALKTGRCFLGHREAVKYAKGSRLVVLSSRAPPEIVERVETAAKSSKTPLYMFPGTPLELGRLLGRRFPVSAVTIRAKGEADLSALVPEAAP
jgi:large subunit ribosomal protein L30e